MDWIARIKSDPDKTLTTIYDDLRPEAIRWMIRDFGLNSDDAEEIFQTGIVLLYDNIATGKLTNLSAGIKTYLFAIIKNKVFHHNRAKSKLASYDASELLRDTLDEEYNEISKDDLDRASSAMIKLGDPCKTLLELSFYQQMDMDEITHLMGYKNSDTTKNLKYKCLKRLQKLFFELIDIN
jgi:RNA polymerase sigma factor (sigma-70 family)